MSDKLIYWHATYIVITIKGVSLLIDSSSCCAKYKWFKLFRSNWCFRKLKKVIQHLLMNWLLLFHCFHQLGLHPRCNLVLIKKGGINTKVALPLTFIITFLTLWHPIHWISFLTTNERNIWTSFPLLLAMMLSFQVFVCLLWYKIVFLYSSADNCLSIAGLESRLANPMPLLVTILRPISDQQWV